MLTKKRLENLHKKLSGRLLYDDLHKLLYATDASVYRKIPLAVVYPKNKKDLQVLIEFATQNKITLIPRAAGTSLAGQCVGDGIVVDVSKHFVNILAFDELKRTITIEPGVVRDELNLFLQVKIPHIEIFLDSNKIFKIYLLIIKFPTKRTFFFFLDL